MGKGDGTKILVELSVIYSSTWSDQHKVTALGKVDNVELNNIKVIDGIISPKVKITGCIDPRGSYPQDPHYVNNVKFIDFELYRSPLTSSYSNLEKNYATNVNFSTTGKEINGHTFPASSIDSYGHNIDFIVR